MSAGTVQWQEIAPDCVRYRVLGPHWDNRLHDDQTPQQFTGWRKDMEAKGFVFVNTDFAVLEALEAVRGVWPKRAYTPRWREARRKLDAALESTEAPDAAG